MFSGITVFGETVAIQQRIAAATIRTNPQPLGQQMAGSSLLQQWLAYHQASASLKFGMWNWVVCPEVGL